MNKTAVVNPVLPYDYCRTYSALKRLVCKYKGLVRFGETGTSYKKRNIPCVVLGRGNKKILVTGAIHGREYVTTGFLLRCVEEYAEGFVCPDNAGRFDTRNLLCEYSFYIVPLANPDSVEIALGRDVPLKMGEDFSAYEYKDNARGVNLNANFPFMWEAVPQKRHKGQAPHSESETLFFMKLCSKHSFLKVLSFHIRGGCIYWRDAGNGKVKDDRETACRMALRCGLELCPVTERAEDYGGGFENWFRSVYKRPAFCIELVKDENAPFDKCCSKFYEYTDFERTKALLLCAV